MAARSAAACILVMVPSRQLLSTNPPFISCYYFLVLSHHDVMSRRTTFRIFIAFAVALAVLAIFVSPLVDIPETVLRAKQIAQLILLALVCLSAACTGMLPLAEKPFILQACDSAPPAASSCAQLSLPLLC